MIKRFELEYPIEQKLSDMDILKEIMSGKTSIDSLDNEIKKRLINLCGEKLENMEVQLAKLKKEEENIEKYGLNFKTFSGTYKNS